jgi:c-di-GMP-binding flagellar brake protein YcgR
MFTRNRRKSFRLSTHHLIRYKVVKGKSVVSFARNVSAGGVLFYSKENIPIKSIVEVVINFPGLPEPIKTNSKVLRVKQLKKVGGYEIGAQFIDLDKKTKDFIKKKIDNTTKGISEKKK